LIAGKRISVSKRAYPSSSPSRLARLLQVGNGACDLIRSIGKRRTLVSGSQLEYLSGDIEYVTGHCFRRWWRNLSVKRPFFVVTGNDPSESIAAITGCDAGSNPRLCLSAHGCVVVVMANWKDIPAVFHYGGCEQSSAELHRQANGLAIASSDPQLCHLVPRLLFHKTLMSGASVIAQTRIPAESYKFSWRRVDAAIDLWLSRKAASENAGTTWMHQQQALVFKFLPGFRDSLVQISEALMEWYGAARIPGGLTHGDFWLGNVLFRGNEVSGIIDWEWIQRDGLAILDCLHMLLISCATLNEVSLTHYLNQIWTDEISEVELRDRISRLCIRSGIDREDLKFVALLFWFGMLSQRAIRGGGPAFVWSEKMITRTMPAILKWLGKHSMARGIRAVTH
jgi:hypothetical protein